MRRGVVSGVSRGQTGLTSLSFGTSPDSGALINTEHNVTFWNAKTSGGASRTILAWGVVADTLQFGGAQSAIHGRCSSVLFGAYNAAVRLFSVEATDISLRTTNIGFYPGNTPAPKPSITGSRGGNAALADLLTKVAVLGLWTDGTSA